MIKRKLYNDLRNHLLKKEITFIVGPRQSGKTTLMLMMKDYLETQKQPVVFFNLDIEQRQFMLTTFIF